MLGALEASRRPARPAQRHPAAAAATRGEGSGPSGGGRPGPKQDGLAAVAERLSEAVAAEDYERAAALRDELSCAHSLHV